MTDIKHLDLDSEEFESAPRALRAYAEKLKKALDGANQTITEFRSRETDTALGEVLAGFRKPDKVKRDLLADNVDPLDSEAVAAWVKENGDDYARASGEPAAAVSEDTAPADPNAPFAAVEAQATPADLTKQALAFAAITPDMDGAAVAELFRKHGI